MAHEEVPKLPFWPSWYKKINLVEKRQLAAIGETDKDRATQLKRGGTKETTAAKGNILYIGQAYLYFVQQFVRLKEKKKKAEARGLSAKKGD